GVGAGAYFGDGDVASNGAAEGAAGQGKARAGFARKLPASVESSDSVGHTCRYLKGSSSVKGDGSTAAVENVSGDTQRAARVDRGVFEFTITVDDQGAAV